MNVTANVTKIKDSSVNPDRVQVRNTGTSGAQISKDSQFTWGNGYDLLAGAEDSFDLEAGEQLFARSAPATTTTIEVL